MLVALVMSIAAQSAGIVLPAGCAGDFQARVLAVEALAGAGDFAGAKARLDSLPEAGLGIVWDESNVPQEQRTAFDAARDAAISEWNSNVPSLKARLATSGGVRVSFDANPPLKAGLPIKVRIDPSSSDGGIDVHLALKIGSPAIPSRPVDIENGLSLALAKYLGVADPFVPGSAANENDSSSPIRTSVRGYVAQTATQNLDALVALRARVQAQQKLSATQSKMVLSTDRLVFDAALQGTPGDKSFTITNTGDGPLKLTVVRTCGCMSLQAPDQIAAGQSATINVRMDTTEFMGSIDKHVILLSNDPLAPSRLFDLHIEVQPRYRFLTPNGTVTSIDSKGGTAVFYLVFANKKPFRIMQMDLNGFAGTVEYQPWSGTLSDPDLGENAQLRTGYKFTVSIPGDIPSGRFPASLNLITDDPRFTIVTFSFYAQKGIIAIPEELFMGDATTGPFTVLLSRPNRPFHVLSARTDNPNVSVAVRETKPGQEYALDVSYGGHAKSGQLKAEIAATTDDPLQKVIRIPVVASVK